MTHLVPRDDSDDIDVYTDKLFSMLNRISRYHWNRAYWPFDNRFYTVGDEFGYNNRLCFFLVDHGTVAEGGDDATVPMLCYEWTGEELYQQIHPSLLTTPAIQSTLSELPFTPGPSPPREKPPIRRLVRRRLREAQRIPDKELEYMQQHPEEMEWLQRKVRPRFWANFLAQIEARPAEKEEEERLGIRWIPLSEAEGMKFR